MKPRLLTLSILALALAACGGDRKKAEPALTGTLQGGAIQGVAWRTPTHSGVTDANGHFSYLPGESVTFSLGDLELGTAPGSSDITLFTLAGLTPPTTEPGLRLQLDRAMRMSTPFTRAMNLDVLLLALDADGDPDNGIDVRQRAADLHGVTLDAGLRPRDFGVELFTKVPSLIQSIPFFKVLGHLYGSLGLRVPVHAQSRVVTDTNGLAAAGLQTFTYDASGLIVSEDEDRDGDGAIDRHSGFGYDAFGRTTRREDRYDNDLDHVYDQEYSADYQFDARGKITGGEESSSDNWFGGRTRVRLVENVVDAFGRTTRQVVDVDDGADGTTDQRQTGITEYDGRYGGVYTNALDSNLDGVSDRIVRSTEVRDARRRIVSITIEWDNDANGAVDSRYTETVVYDDAARTARNSMENDFDADGIVDGRTVNSWKLDAAGNVIAQSTAFEPLADGVIWQSRSITREFDGARRVTAAIRDEDIDGDGMPDSRQLDTTTYDELGNVTWTASDFDAGVDGTRDAHYDEGSEYGASGELLASAAHLDLNGDGLTDIRTGLTVEHAMIEDGVQHLAQWYVMRRQSYETADGTAQ